MKEAEAIRDEATAKWLKQNRFTSLKNGDLSFDHARLAKDYAKDLAPVPAALVAEKAAEALAARRQRAEPVADAEPEA